MISRAGDTACRESPALCARASTRVTSSSVCGPEVATAWAATRMARAGPITNPPGETCFQIDEPPRAKLRPADEAPRNAAAFLRQRRDLIETAPRARGRL